MPKPRIGGTGPPPKPAKAPRTVHLSTSWPPFEFSVHATLVQPGCVKCRRKRFTVRQLRFGGEVVTQDQCASVCDECWAAVLAHIGVNLVNPWVAFWAAKPVEPTGTASLVNLLDFQPHKRTAELWRQFRKDQPQRRIAMRPTD